MSTPIRRYKTSARRRELDEKYRWRKYAKGLTRRGTPRRLKIWTDETLCIFAGVAGIRRRLTAAEKNLARKRALREERKQAGLTINGQPRRYRQWPELAGLTSRARRNLRIKLWAAERRRKGDQLSQREQDWRALRATMPVGILNVEDARAAANRMAYADDPMHMSHS